MTSSSRASATKFLFLTLLGTIASAAACRDTEVTRNQPMTTSSSTTDIAELTRATGLELPKAARLVGVEREDRGEAHLRAKLIMSRDEWAAFSAKLPIPNDLMEPGTGGFLGQDQDWWDPHAARELRTGQIQRQPGVYLNVGVDDSNPSAVSVYIVQHGT